MLLYLTDIIYQTLGALKMLIQDQKTIVTRIYCGRVREVKAPDFFPNVLIFSLLVLSGVSKDFHSEQAANEFTIHVKFPTNRFAEAPNSGYFFMWQKAPLERPWYVGFKTDF